jgi:hypothetical protein
MTSTRQRAASAPLCGLCGSPIVASAPGGPARKWCSPECRRLGNKARRGAERQASGIRVHDLDGLMASLRARIGGR